MPAQFPQRLLPHRRVVPNRLEIHPIQRQAARLQTGIVAPHAIPVDHRSMRISAMRRPPHEGTSRISCRRTRPHDPCRMIRSGLAKTRGTELCTPESRETPLRRSAALRVRRIVARPETFPTPKPRHCTGASVPAIGFRTTARQPTCGRYRKPYTFVICAISATYRPKTEKNRGKGGQCFRFFRDFLDPIPNG